jgi:hypothetical protein
MDDATPATQKRHKTPQNNTTQQPTNNFLNKSINQSINQSITSARAASRWACTSCSAASILAMSCHGFVFALVCYVC